MKNAGFWGYRRQNGRMGTRNYVIILPVDDISNRTAEAVAANVPGTLALPHAYGRLQFGQDLELFFRTLIGVGSNPNVAAVVVIGIEPRWTERIASGIRATGKPVEAFSIEGRGDFAITAMAARAAAGLLQQASELRREEAPVSELWVSAKCGESDTTTGLASCPTVGRVLERVVAGGGNAFFGETSELTGAEHLKSEANRHEYAFDATQIGIAALLQEAATQTRLIDVETHRAQIDNVIADIYERWQKTPT